jgi:hypothetical protein
VDDFQAIGRGGLPKIPLFDQGGLKPSISGLPHNSRPVDTPSYYQDIKQFIGQSSKMSFHALKLNNTALGFWPSFY